MKRLAIYGSGGFAREVAWLAEACNGHGHDREIVAFLDDDPAHWNRRVNDLPVWSLEDLLSRHPDAAVVAGVGAPAVRRQLMDRVAAAGLGTDILVHPGVQRSRWIEIGAGTVICAGNILTTNIRLGSHVQINLDCTVGHDVVMGDYATLAPGVHVSGWVVLGAGSYIGTGASIINGREGSPLVVGDGAVVGAGACVTKPVPPGVTVVGVPARTVERG